MTDQRGSLRLKARLAGAFWVLTVVFGIFAEKMVRGDLIVRGDPAATATHILTAEPLYRLGFLADFAGTLTYLGATLLLYHLMKPVNRALSLYSMLIGLAGCIVLIANLAHMLDIFFYLKGDAWLGAFTLEQRQALAYVEIRSHALGYNIAMALFAVQVLLLGWLILGARFTPRLFGLLFVVEGVAGLIRVVGIFQFPDFPDSLNRYLLMPGLLAEAGFALWLLVMAVDAATWQEQADAAG